MNELVDYVNILEQCFMRDSFDKLIRYTEIRKLEPTQKE